MSSRCTCCHICHTSLKTSRRSFYPCTTCPSIICKPCVELANQDWQEIHEDKHWSCPRCRGDCPCKRCRNKVSSPSEKPKKKIDSQKRKRPTSLIDETTYSPAKIQKTSRRKSKSEASETSTTTKSSTGPRSEPSLNALSATEDAEKEKRLIELHNKNQQCLDYIVRTERLLFLIRSEQDRIASELGYLTGKKSKHSSASSASRSWEYEYTNSSSPEERSSSDSDAETSEQEDNLESRSPKPPTDNKDFQLNFDPSSPEPNDKGFYQSHLSLIAV